MLGKSMIEEITATALVDPIPKFASMVYAGANQVPWLKVKRHLFSKDATIMDINKDVAQRGYEISSFAFSKEKFATEEDVTTYLKDGGYDDYDIVETELAFTVTGKDDNFTGDPAMIDMKDKGLIVTVYPLDNGEEEVAEKTTEVDGGSAITDVAAILKGLKDHVANIKSDKFITSQKFDYWEAYLSNATTLEGVLEDADDGLPAAIYELNEAMGTAIRNTIMNGNLSNITKITAEYGEKVVALAKIFNVFSMSGGEGDTTKALTETQEDSKMSVKSTPVTNTNETVDADADTATKTDAVTEGAIETPEVTDAEKTEKSDKVEASESVEATDTPDMSDVLKAISDLTSVVKSQGETIAAIKQGDAPSRKSKDVDEESNTANNSAELTDVQKSQATSSDFVSNLRNNELGF